MSLTKDMTAHWQRVKEDCKARKNVDWPGSTFEPQTSGSNLYSYQLHALMNLFNKKKRKINFFIYLKMRNCCRIFGVHKNAAYTFKKCGKPLLLTDKSKDIFLVVYPCLKPFHILTSFFLASYLVQRIHYE